MTLDGFHTCLIIYKSVRSNVEKGLGEYGVSNIYF